MIACRSINFKNVRGFLIFKSNFSKSSCLCNIWRKNLGLEPNPTTYGPLKTRPDYSFVDGRPVILGFKKILELERQKQYCKQIAELCKEIDEGLQEYKQNLQEKKEDEERILKAKLKPKGIHFLTKKGINNC